MSAAGEPPPNVGRAAGLVAEAPVAGLRLGDFDRSLHPGVDDADVVEGRAGWSGNNR